MIKIIGKKVIDLIAYQQGILFVVKEIATDGQRHASFYSYDGKTQSIATVTKNAYLMTKFGPAYAAITAYLDDYISCEAQRLADGRVILVYPGGEIGIFADNGSLLHTDTVSYNNHAVRSVTSDGRHLWFAVPDANTIVRYNCDKYRIDLRLGNQKPPTFARPVCVSSDKGKMFVCCKDTNSVQCVTMDDLCVTHHMDFSESILQYLQIGDDAYAVFPSGIYQLT